MKECLSQSRVFHPEVLHEEQIEVYGSGFTLSDRFMLGFLYEKDLRFQFNFVDTMLLENYCESFFRISSTGSVPAILIDGGMVEHLRPDFQWEKDLGNFHLKESFRNCAILDAILKGSKSIFVDQVDEDVVRCMSGSSIIEKYSLEVVCRANDDRAAFWLQMMQAKALILQSLNLPNRLQNVLDWIKSKDSVEVDLQQWLDWLNNLLSDRKFVTGKFTICDIFCAVFLHRVFELERETVLNLEKRIHLNDFWKRLQLFPFFEIFSVCAAYPMSKTIPEATRKKLASQVQLLEGSSGRSALRNIFVTPFALQDFLELPIEPHPRDVLNFWFRSNNLRHHVSNLWFCRNANRKKRLDQHIAKYWKNFVSKAQEGAYVDWESNIEGIAALIVGLDQLSRHVFRGNDKQFSGDTRALRLARQAVSHPDFKLLSLPKRFFVLLPFEHAENKDAQREGDMHFRCLVREATSQMERWFFSFVYYKKLRHEEVINKYGEFPSRHKRADIPMYDMDFL